jgi:hypothetical protein
VAPVRTIQGSNCGLSTAFSLAIDSAGYLYALNSEVAGPALPSVVVFEPGVDGNAVPVRTLSGIEPSLGTLQAIAINRDDQLYVAQNLQALINVYPAYASGAVAPIATIGELARPADIDFDADNNLYVTYPEVGVQVYSVSGELVRSIPIPWGLAITVALDTDGTIYVGGAEGDTGDGWATGTVLVFPPGADVNTPALAKISIDNPPQVPGYPSLAKKRAFTHQGPHIDGRVIELVARLLGGAPVDANGIALLKDLPRPIGPLGPRTQRDRLQHDMMIGLAIGHLASHVIDTTRAGAIRAAAHELVNAKANEMLETPS